MSTTFGFIQEKQTTQTTLDQCRQIISIANASGITLVRVPLFIQQMGSHRDLIDSLLEAGLNVQINFDWSNTSTPVAFPTDAVLIRSKAEAFFSYYAPHKNQIPVVVCENEWDNINYHRGTVHDYINELSIVTEVGRQYGFKIADAGLTGNSLARWYYSQLSGVAAKEWLSEYYVGERNPNYKPLMQAISEYSTLIKDVPIDYLNVHWYNANRCYGGFPDAAKAYQNLCDKEVLISNEFGIRITMLSIDVNKLFLSTVQELKDACVSIGIVYSGLDRAATISTDMLKELVC